VRGATEKYFALVRQPLRSLGREGLDAMRQATVREAHRATRRARTSPTADLSIRAGDASAIH